MYSPLKYLSDSELTAIVRAKGTGWICDIAKAIEDAIIEKIGAENAALNNR